MKWIAKREVYAAAAIIFIITFVPDYQSSFSFLRRIGVNLFEIVLLKHIVFGVIGLIMKTTFALTGIWIFAKAGKRMFAAGVIIFGFVLFS